MCESGMCVTGKGIRAAQAFLGATLSDCVATCLCLGKGTSEVCLDGQLRHPNQVSEDELGTLDVHVAGADRGK